jgi:hypothetical protein
MRSSLSRWVLIVVNLLILAAVQYGIYTIFLGEKQRPQEEIYTVDLKEIENVWRRDVKVPDPNELTGPIRAAFGSLPEDPKVPEDPKEIVEEGEGMYQGPLVVVGIIYAPAKPIVALQVEGGREHFTPGELLPDGSVLETVERVAPDGRAYRIHVRKDDKTEIIDWEGKPL